MKKYQIFTFILAAFLVLPISASALGQMTQPINITDALRGQQISDFPLCNKSFNLSYCGFDL
jgi:hypothetical protein